MTQKLFEMAVKAGLQRPEGISEFAYIDRLEFLESMIRADEREQCAKVADYYATGMDRNYSVIIADTIRAKGKNA